MLARFNSLTLLVKILILLDFIVVITQVVFLLLYFTPARDSVATVVSENLGSYDAGTVFGLFISILAFSILIHGMLSRKHWAVLLQVFLFSPLFFTFPLGTILFIIIVYKMVKLERRGYFS